MGHARALVNLPDDKTQLRVWRRIQQKGLSVRQVEEIVRRIGTPAMTQRKPAGPALTVLEGSTLVLENFATRLRYILGTKVKIHPKEEGKGEIVIEYYSDEDLGRILDLFNIIEKQSQ